MGLGGAVGETGSFPGKDTDRTGTNRKLWVVSLKNSLEFQEMGVEEMECKVEKRFCVSLETSQTGYKAHQTCPSLWMRQAQFPFS